jgi:heat shock protein HslJ
MTAAVPDVDASLIFGEDGTISGNVGCNSLGGEYTVDGDQITFNNLASTLMACDDVLMDQESAVLQVLSGTARFEIENETLTIVNSDMTLVFAVAAE